VTVAVVPPQDVLEFAEVVVSSIDAGCPELLVGAYLHGSAALGGWTPSRSDVDVLLIAGEPRAGDAALIGESVLSHVGRCPGRGLEVSVVTVAHARRPLAPWPFVVHVNTAADPGIVVSGDGASGDPDLSMHYVTCRAVGWRLRGPEPKVLIGTVDDSVVLDYLADELGWGLIHATEAYAVLNACRALVFLRDRLIVSKVDGGRKAIEDRLGPAGLISRSLRSQAGAEPERGPGESARVFVNAAQDALRSAASQSLD
jgi:hypothetical protein